MNLRRINAIVFEPVPAALGVLTLLHLAYVWSHEYFISQDGGAHAYTAWILLHYSDPAYPFLREYFTLDLAPYPNWTGYWILVPLLRFVSSGVAEKLLVSIYAISFPAAIYYSIVSVRKSSAWLALPAAALTLNWYLHMAFYNFLLGVVFALFATGYFHRRLRRPSPARVAFLAAVLVLVYFSHLLAIAAAAAAAAMIGANGMLRSGSLRVAARRLWPWLAAAVPASALTLWFLLQPPPSGRIGGQFFAWEALVPRLRSYLTLNPCLYVFRASEKYPQVALEALFGLVAAVALTAVARGKCRRTRGQLAAGVVCFLIALIGPEEYGGGGYVAVRFAIFGYLFIFIGAAGVRWPGWAARIGGTVSFALAVGVMAFRVGALNGLAGQYAEFETAFSSVRRGEAVLPVILTRMAWRPPNETLSEPRTAPLLHFAGHAAIRRELIDFSHYQASADFFPVRWRTGLSPLVIGDIGQPYPHIAPDKYEAAHPGRLTGVMIWDNGGPESAFGPPRRYLESHMRTFLVRTNRSVPNGFGEYYSRPEPNR